MLTSSTWKEKGPIYTPSGFYSKGRDAEQLLYNCKAVFPFLNPSSPKFDRHKFYPNSAETSLWEKIMKTIKVITKGNMLWPFIKFSQLTI